MTLIKNYISNANGGFGTVMALWCLVWMMTSRLVFSQDTCSCSPLVYRWTLDFSNSCNFSSQGNPSGDIGISVGLQEAVQSATCSVKIEKPTSPVTEESLQPVLVKGFQFVELGVNLQRIKVVSNPLNFVPLLDGGALEFTSEAASGMEMPSALIAFIFAENADGDDIQLEWLIRFSTLCDVAPFQVGDSLGWLKFSGVTNARDETCKLASNVPTVESTTVAPPQPTPTTKNPTPTPSTPTNANVLITASPNISSTSPTMAPALARPDDNSIPVVSTRSPTAPSPTKNTSSSMAPTFPKWSKSSKSSKSSKGSKSSSSKKSKKAKQQSPSVKSKKSKKSNKSKSEKHVKSSKSQKGQGLKNNRSLRGPYRRQLR